MRHFSRVEYPFIVTRKDVWSELPVYSRSSPLLGFSFKHFGRDHLIWRGSRIGSRDSYITAFASRNAHHVFSDAFAIGIAATSIACASHIVPVLSRRRLIRIYSD